MKRNLAKAAGLVVLTIVMVSVPTLAGCGEAGGANTVVIGFLGDFTGPSSATCLQLQKGIADYISVMERDDPIRDVDIRVITYDSRLDYSRVKPGYVWLTVHGADIIMDYNAIYTLSLISSHQRDKIPSFCFNSMREVMGEDYMYGFSVDYQTEAEAIAEWLLQEWADSGETRPIKIGHVGMAGMVSDTEVGGTLESLGETTYAGEMEVYREAAPTGTTTWAAEVGRLKACDVIVVNVVGPSMSTFLNEAINRGYQGEFLGTTISFMGFWDLVRANIPLNEVDGVRAIHAQMLWTDDSTFMQQLAADLESCRPGEAAELKKGTSYPSGYLFAMILVDTIRRAAEAVGPDNVDGPALNDAMKTIDLDVDGWGEAWQCHEGTNILHRQFRVIEYRYAQDDWFQVEGGGWFLPAAMVE